ncbi:RNA binding protein HABP4/SERBP1 [Gracilaria domingensis]|nr:RNA binding protein HABP4/SERBP1 [Gracilaria domingensis]
MNSFALLQDDVEDTDVAYDSAAPQKAAAPAPVPAVDVRDAAVTQAPDDVNGADPVAPDADTAPNPDHQDAHKPDQKPPKQKDLTLEEYLAKKAAMSSGLASLKSRGVRQANDGADGFEKMSVLKKNTSPDDNSIMKEVAVKAQQQNKTLKDSTQAAVARNAEIQKFFKPDPSERRRGDYRRNYGERRGGARGRFEHRGDRGRGERGRGGRGGRGAYRGAYRGGFSNRQHDIETEHRSVNGHQDAEVVPNVDDTSAFPSL